MKPICKLLVMMAAMVLLSTVLQVSLTAKYADWVSTDGLVTDIVFRNAHRRRSKDSYEIYFRYTVEGIDYEGFSAYSGSETDQTVGKAVTIWYDPHDPGASSFHRPGPGLWPFVPFIFGVPLTMRVLDSRKYGRKR